MTLQKRELEIVYTLMHVDVQVHTHTPTKTRNPSLRMLHSAIASLCAVYNIRHSTVLHNMSIETVRAMHTENSRGWRSIFKIFRTFPWFGDCFLFQFPIWYVAIHVNFMNGLFYFTFRFIRKINTIHENLSLVSLVPFELKPSVRYLSYPPKLFLFIFCVLAGWCFHLVLFYFYLFFLNKNLVKATNLFAIESWSKCSW